MYVYLHIACLADYRDRIHHYLDLFRSCGMYPRIDEIRCGVLGPEDAVTEIRDMDPKIRILGHHPSLEMYEGFTLNYLWRDASHEDFQVLYLHTKGITHQPRNPNVEDWIVYMLYFLVERHEMCMGKMETNDAVGVNLRKITIDHRPYPLHYSGNFWWSSSAHIRRLVPCEVRQKFPPELWITSHQGGRYECLWESGHNPYCESYPRWRYVQDRRHVYLHIACLADYRDRIHHYLDLFRSCGMYPRIDEIRCGVLGPEDAVTEIRDMDPKIRILGHHPSLEMYEGFTLNYLWRDAYHEDFQVLYLHTKGIIHQPRNPNVEDWIAYMLYFLVERHEMCMENIRTTDTVGVNLRDGPHYSGNFWWSRSQHIRRLQPCTTDKASPEHWITSSPNGQYACLCETYINHYFAPFPRECYATDP